MIEVKDIHKSFNGQHILKGVSATFHKSDTSMIIGSSGSGKTVFLKCLLGLFSPEKGDICYDGRHYSKMSLKEKNHHLLADKVLDAFISVEDAARFYQGAAINLNLHKDSYGHQWDRNSHRLLAQ